MTSLDTHFIVGDTVHLRSRVALPDGSKVPVDPQTVQLTSWRTGTQELLTGPINFAREGTGEYSLALETAGMDPGTYHVTVVHSGGPQKISIAIDSYVLQSA